MVFLLRYHCLFAANSMWVYNSYPLPPHGSLGSEISWDSGVALVSRHCSTSEVWHIINILGKGGNICSINGTLVPLFRTKVIAKMMLHPALQSWEFKLLSRAVIHCAFSPLFSSKNWRMSTFSVPW